MSRAETKAATVVFLRWKAAHLRNGYDEETRRYASELERQADEIDPRPQAAQEERS